LPPCGSEELPIQCNNVIEAAVNHLIFVGDGDEHERGWRRRRSRRKWRGPWSQRRSQDSDIGGAGRTLSVDKKYIVSTRDLDIDLKITEFDVGLKICNKLSLISLS
jgi:hypothetical protein